MNKVVVSIKMISSYRRIDLIDGIAQRNDPLECGIKLANDGMRVIDYYFNGPRGAIDFVYEIDKKRNDLGIISISLLI